MLKLEKLKLKNFGAILDKEINFDDGLNLIIARNGKGKTTIQQCISMHLSDSCEGKYEDYINYNHDYFETTLIFSINDNRYESYFKFEKGRSNTSTKKLIDLSNDNKPLADSPTAHKTYMLKLIDPLLVKYGLFVKQGTKPQDMEDNIVSCKDADRRELFKKIQDVDYKKEVDSYIEPVLVEIKDSIANIEKEIYRLETSQYDIKDLDTLPFSKESLSNKEKSLGEINNKINEIKQFNDSIERKEKELSESKSSLMSKDNSLKSKEETLISLNNKINYFNSEEYKLKLDSYRKKIEEKNHEKIESEDNKKDSIIQVKNQFQKDVILLKETISSLEEKLSDPSLKVKRFRPFNDSELTDLIIKKSQIDTNISHVKEKQTLLDGGVCPTCGQNCENVGHNLSEEIKSLQDKKDKISNEIDQLNKIKEEIKDKEEKNNQVREERNKIENDLTVKENELEKITDRQEREIEKLEQEYRNNIQSCDSAILSLQKDIERDEAEKTKMIMVYAEQIDSTKNDISSIKEDINTISKQILFLTDELNNVEKKKVTEDLKGKSDSLNSEIKSYYSIIERNKVIKENNDKVIKQKEEDEKSLQAYEKKKQDELNQKLYYEQAKNTLLKDFPNFIIENNVSAMTKNMNDFIEQVYYKSLKVRLRATKTSIKLEYGTGGKKLPAHRLSGAESRLVQLSFISNFKKYLKCIILDEPDSAMDNDNKIAMYDILIEMADIYSQMIIVTHSDKMKTKLSVDNDPNLIYL